MISVSEEFAFKSSNEISFISFNKLVVTIFLESAESSSQS